MQSLSARTCTPVALTVLALLFAACDAGHNEGSYRDRLLGRLPERAMSELREQGPAAIPELIALTTDPVPEVASKGILLITMIKPSSDATDAIPALMEAMKYPDKRVRDLAVGALKGMQPASIPYVLQGLSAGDKQVRRGSLEVASKGLGKGAKAGIPKFNSILSTGTDQEKVWAAFALASIGSPAMDSIPLIERAAEGITKKDWKHLVKGCAKRLKDSTKAGMYTDSR